MTGPMTRLRTAALLLGVALLAGCEKGGPQDILGALPGARIRFFNFGVNTPNVNFYAGNTKLTAISAATCTPATNPPNPACLDAGLESTVGTAYGAAGSAGLYSAIEPGQYAFTGRISAATDKDLAVSTVQTTVESGKAYSYYMSGIYNTTAKTVEAFVVEDPIPEAVDFAVATVRFVNAISNSQPMALTVRNTTTGATVNVGAAVAYRAAGAFVTLPPGVYDIATRASGGTTDLITRTAVSFVAGRVSPVSARGDMTVAGATAVNRPFLDVTANR